MTEAFSPQITAYIADTAMPEFQHAVSQPVGEIIKSIGTDFVMRQNPEEFMRAIKIAAPQGADLGVSDPFSMAVGVSVGAAMTLSFATVGGGIGKELGVAIISAILGTTGPVGFVIGLIIGAVLAAGAWWFGKERLTAAIDQVNLPAAVVRAALWESRFERLIADGRKKCEESVQAKINERLMPIIPEITDDIILRIRSLGDL